MKKFFLLVCVLLSTLLTFAQTKKVAILEVVDKEGRLSYSQKLVLRSNMARAVANTTGYEAYDRTDVDMVMSEHDFQRTGLVRKEEIRKLGEMTGVSLILVTEGVLTGDGKIFVSAKILNVETARVEMMENLSMGLSSDAIQEGCIVLTKRLFGASASTTVIEKYNIKRLGSNEYLYMNKYMDKNGYEQFIHANCFQAFQEFEKGKKYIKGGWACTGVGIAFITGAILCFGLSVTDNTGFLAGMGGAFLGVGIPAAACGIPLIVIGNRKQQKSVDIYNKNCTSSSTVPLTFNFTAGQNGVGLALRF